MQTQTTVFILGNNIKFCFTVLIFGSRSMVTPWLSAMKNIGIGPKKALSLEL